MDEDFELDSDEEVVLALCEAGVELGNLAVEAIMRRPAVRRPIPVPMLTGLQWIQQKLSNPNICFRSFRMSPAAFLHLHKILVDDYGLKATAHTTSLEVLGIYVWTLAHASPARLAGDRFERSIDTICRKTSHVADVMYKFCDSIIVPRDTSYSTVSAKLKPYEPWLDGCIGCLDGTLIPVIVNKKKALSYYCRKGYTAINVLAIVDMDMRYTFVGAGMSGANHDKRILDECRLQPNFPHPPPGRFYLADSGYKLEIGYLTPYPGTRYHLDEFRGVPRRLFTEADRFNQVHSSLRATVERSFGVTKRQWPLLQGVPLYKEEKMIKMVTSCYGLHNYNWDWEHGAAAQPGYPVSAWPSQQAYNDMVTMRDNIANGLNSMYRARREEEAAGMPKGYGHEQMESTYGGGLQVHADAEMENNMIAGGSAEGAMNAEAGAYGYYYGYPVHAPYGSYVQMEPAYEEGGHSHWTADHGVGDSADTHGNSMDVMHDDGVDWFGGYELQPGGVFDMYYNGAVQPGPWYA